MLYVTNNKYHVTKKNHVSDITVATLRTLTSATSLQHATRNAARNLKGGF